MRWKKAEPSARGTLPRGTVTFIVAVQVQFRKAGGRAQLSVADSQENKGRLGHGQLYLLYRFKLLIDCAYLSPAGYPTTDH